MFSFDRTWNTLSEQNIVCFRHSSQGVVSAALRAVGNIVTGDDIETQACIIKIKNLVQFMYQFHQT
jgi:hypothetical protein